eukprot:TRINITY_DN52006_c0_g1_i1.p2 TRINITY_DN52006_c0_g1~~TRINITY_DN52006_c0_g1_i1.p2  ORF type:complete len:170 (-),score=46.52 TRINITY_DN52006_c0_g1_i1:154-663(-)
MPKFCTPSYAGYAGEAPYRDYPPACRHAAELAEKVRQIERLEEEVRWLREHRALEVAQGDESKSRLQQEQVRRKRLQQLVAAQSVVIQDLEDAIQAQQDSIQCVFGDGRAIDFFDLEDIKANATAATQKPGDASVRETSEERRAGVSVTKQPQTTSTDQSTRARIEGYF